MILSFVLQNTEITTALQTHPDKLLSEFNFADNHVSLDRGKPEVLEHFQTMESFAMKVGWNINYDKTKIIMKNVDNPRIQEIVGNLVMKVAKNITLEVVNYF